MDYGHSGMLVVVSGAVGGWCLGLVQGVVLAGGCTVVCSHVGIPGMVVVVSCCWHDVGESACMGLGSRTVQLAERVTG